MWLEHLRDVQVRRRAYPGRKKANQIVEIENAIFLARVINDRIHAIFPLAEITHPANQPHWRKEPNLARTGELLFLAVRDVPGQLVNDRGFANLWRTDQ